MTTTGAEVVSSNKKKQKSGGVLDDFFDRFSHGLFRFFYNLGVYVDDNAQRVVLITILVTVVAGVGFMRFESESRPEKLFTPQDSPAIDEQIWVQDAFPATQRFIALYAAKKTGDKDKNLMPKGREILTDMFAVHAAMGAGTVGASPYTLPDLCIKNQINSCTISSPLAFWGYSKATFDADADWIATLSQTAASDCCYVRPTITPGNVMGGVTRDATGRITAVDAFKMQWIIKEQKVVENGATSDPGALALEENFSNYVEKIKPTGDEVLLPYNRWIQSKAVSGTFAQDGILTFISYIMITAFATWILSDSKNPVYSRARLGPYTVLVVGFSIITSFGIVIACGVKFNPVVSSVIFVLLGVGVDDSLVVIEHMDKEGEKGTKPRLRIPTALAKAGGSISLTSVTDFAAFISGASTIIPAIRIFCIFAGVAVFIDFAMQVTCFIAFLRFDEERIQRGEAACSRSCWSCCIPTMCKCSTHKEVSDKSVSVELVPMNRAAESGAAAAATTTTATANVDASALVAEPASYIKDTLSRRIVTKYLPDLILSPYGKVGVFVLTAGILAMSAVGITKLQLDFQSSWFIPDGTVAKDAFNLSQKYFTGENLPVSFYTKDIDYYAHRADMLDLCTKWGENKWVVADSVSCWMEKWNTATSGAASAGYGNSAAFYSNLNTYLNGAGAQFKPFVKWNSDTAPTKVIATKTFSTFTKAETANENIDAMTSVRDTVAKFPTLDAIAFSEPFVFWEGLKICYAETVRNVAVTLAVVYFICILFLGDIWAATLCAANIILVDFCLFGFLYWFGMHMNTVIAINLIMAIGLTVDYSAHLVHAYMHVDGEDANARMRAAFEKIGVSIFNGGATTFVAVFALVGANSYVFDSFFRCFVLIIVFGLYFGMIFLPVLLTLCGPTKVFHHEAVTTEGYASAPDSSTSADDADAKTGDSSNSLVVA